MKTIRVQFPNYGYDIVIDRGSLSRIGEFMHAKGKQVMIVTDDHVAPLYLQTVVQSLQRAGLQTHSLTLPSGEPTKRFDMLPVIYDALIAAGLTRSDCMLALGGGVIGDITGFAAATYLRGIDYYQVPTSLLAQVDSSVGGKVAVDLPQGKNLVGQFYQPKGVWIDVEVLQTLPDLFFRDGMGEVIKYGCICDRTLFENLRAYGGKQGVYEHMEEIVATCCDIKRRIVEQDEKDLGQRMLLNFGHTYGHALEKYYNYCGLTHGQAVAIGMYRVTELTQAQGLTAAGTLEQLGEVLQMYGLPMQDPTDSATVARCAMTDKKHFGNRLMAVILKQIGESCLYPTDADFFAREV